MNKSEGLREGMKRIHEAKAEGTAIIAPFTPTECLGSFYYLAQR